jgi:hypothetical protein
MNAALYRRIRIAVGALVLGFCVLAFADVGDWLSATAARAGLWFQLTPSMLALTQGAGWIAAGCVGVALLTLMFGRIYCAMLCPLGVLMDLSAWLARRTGKKRKLPYRMGWPRLRLLSVAVCAGGLIAGTAVPLGFLDPYSLFGKITSATLRPAFGWINQMISRTGMIKPVDVSQVSWISIGVALGLLTIIVISAIHRGRLWCNTACPVWAVLGFLSKHSLFRPHRLLDVRARLPGAVHRLSQSQDRPLALRDVLRLRDILQAQRDITRPQSKKDSPHTTTPIASDQPPHVSGHCRHSSRRCPDQGDQPAGKPQPSEQTRRSPTRREVARPFPKPLHRLSVMCHELPGSGAADANSSAPCARIKSSSSMASKFTNARKS